MPTPAPPHPFFSLAQLQGVLSLIGTALVVLGAATATAFLVPKARLIRERNEAMAWVQRLEGRLTAQSADLQAVLANVEALRGDVADARAVMGEMRDEALVTRKTLIVAFRHIAAQITWGRSRKPLADMPELPPEIADGVLAELRAHELETGAAVQGAAGVVPAATPP